MIGSGVVSLPYAAKQAGIIPFICKFKYLPIIGFNILFFLLCFYTCNVISKTGGSDNDYSDTVHAYLGRRYGYVGRVLQIVFSMAINVMGGFIYFLIIK
jgi:amino acid permease